LRCRLPLARPSRAPPLPAAAAAADAAQVVDHLARFGTLTYWRVLPPRVQDLNLALMAFYSTAGEAAAAIAGLKNLPVGDDGPL
jgi:hypothetical protein